MACVYALLGRGDEAIECLERTIEHGGWWKTWAKNDPDLESIRCDARFVALVEVDKDDLLHYVTWGGGGWGDPLQRDPEIVAAEVRRGLVSVDGAADYGVVLGKDNSVDVAATEKLRKKMAKERGEPSLFDFGPDIESLRKTCLKDTGLPAPKQPIWKQSWPSEKTTQKRVAAL